MQFKSLFLGLCLGVFGAANAGNTVNTTNPSTAKGVNIPAPCGAEVINNSNYTVHISSALDDNSRREEFDLYPYARPRFLDLYNGYCHPLMFVKIQSNVYPYRIIYNDVAYDGDTLRIVNDLMKSVKVETTHK